MNIRRFANLGFTLIELLVVIAVIALIAALLVTKVQQARENANVVTQLSKSALTLPGWLRSESSESQLAWIDAKTNLLGQKTFFIKTRYGRVQRYVDTDDGYPPPRPEPPVQADGSIEVEKPATAEDQFLQSHVDLMKALEETQKSLERIDKILQEILERRKQQLNQIQGVVP